MRPIGWALCATCVVVLGLGACSQPAPTTPTSPAANTAPTSAIQGATPAVGVVEGHFNPTEAIGGGANSSSAVTDLSSVFATVAQASQLKITANSNPPGVTGAEVETVSIVATDNGGLLKSLDSAGKQTLGNALLTAAVAQWPNASISLLVSDPTGGGGSIIGNHPKGGQSTVFGT